MDEPFALPNLDVLRLRLSMRLLADARLPAFKGALFRGGFGYAFQRATCPDHCWGRAHACGEAVICPYRWVFETPHPPGVAHLHDLQDLPRPFALRPPPDSRTSLRAGDLLEFDLALLGRGIDYLPYFLFGFARLGELGLGAMRSPARLERVEALEPWRPAGPVVYQNGHALAPPSLPRIGSAAIFEQAAALGPDLRLTIETPLRIKAGGQVLDHVDLPAFVRALAWRLDALATFHGGGPWGLSHRTLAERARDVFVQHQVVRWVQQERRSDHRGEPQSISLSGMVGSATLRDVPLELRALLLAGSLVNVGKASVFGNGAISVEAI
jgi:hypothetical protein